MHQLSTAEIWVFLCLFAVASSGLFWALWQGAKVTPSYILKCAALFALTAFDGTMLIFHGLP